MQEKHWGSGQVGQVGKPGKQGGKDGRWARRSGRETSRLADRLKRTGRLFDRKVGSIRLTIRFTVWLIS